MNEDKISFTIIYTECNNHLREQDKNRDQLISFYLVLVAAFLAGTNNQAIKHSVTLIGIFIFILGLIVSKTIIEFRIWHTRYSYTSILITALSRPNDKTFVEIAKNQREDSYLKSALNIKSEFMPINWLYERYWKGTEFYTSLTALVITFLPLYIALTHKFIYPQQVPQTAFITKIIIFSSLLVLFTIIQLYFASYIYHKFSACPWATWLLYGLDKNLDEELKIFLYKSEHTNVLIKIWIWLVS
jgi:hypothetical protein